MWIRQPAEGQGPQTLHYLTNISTPSDIEYFNLPVTNADVGRMVRISLSHLPGVDYDLVLYGANASSSLRGAPIDESNPWCMRTRDGGDAHNSAKGIRPCTSPYRR